MAQLQTLPLQEGELSTVFCAEPRTEAQRVAQLHFVQTLQRADASTHTLLSTLTSSGRKGDAVVDANALQGRAGTEEIFHNMAVNAGRNQTLTLRAEDLPELLRHMRVELPSIRRSFL